MNDRATAAFVDSLGRFNAFVCRCGVVIASVFIAIMTIVVILGVFFRYVLNNSLSWVEDVSLIMMVTVAFLVAAFAYRTGSNVAIEYLIDKFPKKISRVVQLVIHTLVLWILYRYLIESFALIDRGWGIKVNSLPISWAWCYMVIPVCFVAMILVGFELLLRNLLGLFSGTDDMEIKMPSPTDINPVSTQHDKSSF